MFRPTDNSVISPVTTAVFRAPAKGETFESYLADFKCNNPNTVATVGGMVLFLAEYSKTGADLALRASLANMFEATAADYFVNILGLDIDANPDIKGARMNYPNSVNWLINLLSASKKSLLTSGNVDGFFASMGHTGTSGSAVASLINKISPFFSDAIGDDTFRALLMDGMWTTYRNTRVSSGPVIWGRIKDLVDLGILEVGDAEYQAVHAANNAPWDLNLAAGISERLKAYTSIYLETAGQGIESWYQGNRAVDEFPAVKVKAAKKIFKRYLTLKSEVVDLDTISSVAEFKADETIKAFW